MADSSVSTKEDIDTAVTNSIVRWLPVTGPFMTADMGWMDLIYLFADLMESNSFLKCWTN